MEVYHQLRDYRRAQLPQNVFPEYPFDKLVTAARAIVLLMRATPTDEKRRR